MAANKTPYSKKSISEYQKYINAENAVRMKSIIIFLLIIQAVFLAYDVFIGATKPEFYSVAALKLLVIALCVVSIFIFNRVKDINNPMNAYGNMVICIIITLFLFWAISNTFIVQSITSDISIYILVLYGIAAFIRIKPICSATVFFSTYIYFALRIGQFQTFLDYAYSHRINSFILTCIAWIIARSMYLYSCNNFCDKLEIQEKNKRLSYLTEHDGLTDLYNHQAIHNKLEDCIELANEFDRKLSIIILDVDFFKRINDDYGHKKGDEVMKDIASYMQSFLRESDLIGRYGGDEFLIILPNTAINIAREMADIMVQGLRTKTFDGLNITISCGVSEFIDESAEKFVEKADFKLYQAKKNGRDNVIA